MEIKMTEEQIKYMVDRFLGWKLPGNFSPDGGITFRVSNPVAPGPSGTNLLDATQVDAMVRHMVEGMPHSAWLIEAPGPRYLAMKQRDGEAVFEWTPNFERSLVFSSGAHASDMISALRQMSPQLFGFERTLGSARAVENTWTHGCAKPADGGCLHAKVAREIKMTDPSPNNQEDVQITSVMISAGESAILGEIGSLGGLFSASDLARKVYLAMASLDGSRQSSSVEHVKDPGWPEERSPWRDCQVETTRKQMENAAPGALFVWCNNQIYYPKDLAKRIGRGDLRIIGPAGLDGPPLTFGFPEIIVDHAALLSRRQHEAVEELRAKAAQGGKWPQNPAQKPGGGA
jgi:hypothetical protein